MDSQDEESDRSLLLERALIPNGAEDLPTVSGMGSLAAESSPSLKEDDASLASQILRVATTPRANHQRSDSDDFWSPRADGLTARESNSGNQILSGLESIEAPGKSWAAGHPLVFLILGNLFYILLWYFFSISLTLYNNLLVGKEHGHFPAPLMMTTAHFCMQALFAWLLLRMRCCGERISKRISWRDYFTKIVPTGIATAMDIGLSNLSFVLITVPFYEMCKSSAPVFLLLFAFLFRLESPSFKLLGVIVIICIGELLTVAGESQFNHLGFFLVMLSAVMAGFRWTITQILLQKEALGMTSPVVTLSYLAPVMAIAMFVWSMLTEPWWKLTETMYFNSLQHSLGSIALMLVGGMLAFLMILTEFQLISMTSAVTFTVAGVVKEVATIVASVILLHDPFGVVNLAGLFVVILGVSLFNIIKFQKMREGKLVSSHGHGSSSVHLLEAEEGLRPGNYEMLQKGGGGGGGGLGGGDGGGAVTLDALSSEQQDAAFTMSKHQISKMKSEAWPYSPRLTSRSPRASLVRTTTEDHDDKPG